MASAEVLNAISIDVEDWPQSVINRRLPLTNRFCDNTRRVLEVLAAHEVKGTFFVLGLAAKKAPDIVREIQQAGHEIQSHGYGHELVHTLTPKQFRADLEHAKKLLEDIAGTAITGYRAPAFSIGLENLWALDVLVETGHIYDSSVFPLRTSRYGIDGAPWHPHRLKTPAGYHLLECPVASWRVGKRTIPIGGGGYFRLFPYFLIRRAVRQINQAQQPATIYMHPYEYNPVEISGLDYPVPWKTRLHQGLGRRRFPGKIDALLGDFRFGTMREMIDSLRELPIHEYRHPGGK